MDGIANWKIGIQSKKKGFLIGHSPTIDLSPSNERGVKCFALKKIKKNGQKSY
jgi:hypothetical protein